jgi:hypothetical protein
MTYITIPWDNSNALASLWHCVPFLRVSIK